MANYPYMNYQQPYQPYMQQPFQNMQQFVPQPVPQTMTQMPTQPQQNQVYGQSAFLCIPVTSRAEAEAQRVEAFGPAVIMPDPGHGAIYYKKFNQDTALADFIEFRAVSNQNEQNSSNVPQIDFNAVLGAIGAFNGRFDAMGEKLDSIASRIETAYSVETEPDNDHEPAPVTRRGGAKK